MDAYSFEIVLVLLAAGAAGFLLANLRSTLRVPGGAELAGAVGCSVLAWCLTPFDENFLVPYLSIVELGLYVASSICLLLWVRRRISAES